MFQNGQTEPDGVRMVPGCMGEQQAFACDQPHERFSLFVAKRHLNQEKLNKIRFFTKHKILLLFNALYSS